VAITKSLGEIDTMRRAGMIVASILKILSKEIKAGMTTRQLDDIAVKELERHRAISSFKGYGGFPATLCVSVNEEMVHGIPDDRKIHKGDIVSLDFGAKIGGFSVVCEYTGHDIGRELHEDPQTPNFGKSNFGSILRKGMTVAIEPMVNIGGWETKVKNNHWTVVTADGSSSAHFEKTIAITDRGAEVLTAWGQ
jgi:methionyl aminopeptidase